MGRLLARIVRKKTTPVYSIGAASRLTGLPVYTLRWIEKHELVSPERTEGRQRLFSDADIELLQLIRSLIEEGVNMQGVRVIIKMRIKYEIR
jgi:MerR family transcriptional regulator, glutamine synthetase repressor